MNNGSFLKLLCILFLLILYKTVIKPREFRIEMKDVNLSYYFYGYGLHSCGKNKLLIATMSRPDASDLRMAVRNSWKKDIPPYFTHKFFIGWTSNETQRKLNEIESYKYRDIIFTNIFDSYLNITLKMTSLYQWQQYYCPKVDYFLRADEDTLLDVSRLQYWMEKEFNVIKNNLNEMAVYGHLFENAPVLRNPNEKWYVSYEAYNKTHYPDFVNGPSYMITSKAIKLILKEAKNYYNFGSVDDALFTGIISQKLGIKVIDSKKHFAYGNPVDRWDHQACDENGVPYFFSIFDENGEIETAPDGYNKYLKKLKELSCPLFNIVE